jgi:mRNA-degrading endonuclease RelE of RelBE toxin-antitoxin system
LVKRLPPDEVRGSEKFMAFYSSLDKKSEEYKRITSCIDAIKENRQVGEKVQKDKFPKYYVRKYEISNLYRVEIGDCRLSYTLIADGLKKVACILEYFPTHKEYSKRFGYKN